MTTAHAALLTATVLCTVANAYEVAAKLAAAPFVVENIAKVGLDRRWLPRLAAVEGAGVLGLLAGFARFPALGLAAAVGLTAFFVLAVLTHIRTRVLGNIAFPLVFLLLAAASVAYFAQTAGS